MLSLVEHQKYFRVLDIKEKDLFEVDAVVLKVKPFFNKIDLANEDDENKNDLFKRIKSLGMKFTLYNIIRN